MDEFSKLIQIINNRIDSSLYNKLNLLPSNDIFKYICIIITLLVLVRFMKINIGVIFALILSLVIIYLLYDKKNLELSTETDQTKIKLASITPPPKMFDKYVDIINIFYSINELYGYNPDVFTSLVNYVDSFLVLYENIGMGIKHCHQNAENAKKLSKDALNALHSLIFTIENNYILENKLTKAMYGLQVIFKKYLTEITNICNNDIKLNGYSNEKNMIYDKGPVEYNLFHNEEYNYDIY